MHSDGQLDSRQPVEILKSARNLERLDFVARCNYRLENVPADIGPLNLSVRGGHTAIQIINRT